MQRFIKALLGLSLLLPAAAVAQDRALFESLDGWQVERSFGVAGNAQCAIVRNYVDEDDDDADNAITFALENKALVVVLRYGKWEFDKDEKVTASTLFDDKTASAKSSWIGNGTQLVANLPAGLAAKAADAEEISLKGKDWEATFDLYGAEDAFEAMKRCNAGEAPTPRP